MNYEGFLNQVIDEGIAGAKEDYCKPEDADKLKGSLLGFEECRGKDVIELTVLLDGARKKTIEKHRDSAPDYWYWRCREGEIEWVVNVVSALMLATKRTPIINPTARGYMKMAEIIRKDEGCMAVREGVTI